MLTKQGMLAEDVKIQVGNRSYHNLAHYSPNCRYAHSIFGGIPLPDFFEYDKTGEPVVAKFMPAFAGIGNATRKIRIPIYRMREEIKELEAKLWKAVDDESNVTVIGEGRFQFRVNEQAERIRELIKQRRDFLDMHIDFPRELEQHYAGIELSK